MLYCILKWSTSTRICEVSMLFTVSSFWRAKDQPSQCHKIREHINSFFSCCNVAIFCLSKLLQSNTQCHKSHTPAHHCRQITTVNEGYWDPQRKRQAWLGRIMRGSYVIPSEKFCAVLRIMVRGDLKLLRYWLNKHITVLAEFSTLRTWLLTSHS